MIDAEIDAKVAERVMGWVRHCDEPDCPAWALEGGGHRSYFKPTRDYNHTREMEDEIERRGLTYEYVERLGRQFYPAIYERGDAGLLLRATARERCLAALEVCDA